MAAKNYLSWITGNKPTVDLDQTVKDNGLKSLLPTTVQDYIDLLDKSEDEGIHSYLCNLDKDQNAGQESKCVNGKYESDEDKRRSKNQGWGFIQWNDGSYRLFADAKNTHSNAKNQIGLPPRRKLTGIDSGLVNTYINQGYGTRNLKGKSPIVSSKSGKTYSPITIDNRDARLAANNKQNHIDAVNGVKGKTVGHRAILFDANGKVLRGANGIRDADKGAKLSSTVPSGKPNNGEVPTKIGNAYKLSTNKHSSGKKGIGQTNDVMGGVAALGGIAAVAGILAALMPLHFLTSAITFLTSITTMITNVGNIGNTYLAVVDGVLTLFGKKDATKAMKTLMESTIDGMFGKENVQSAKAAFAKGINTISTTTKLLEKVETGRRGTNNKVDQVAFSLGTVNNSLKDSGMIPLDSPYMAESKAIDDFVAARAKVEGNESLTENINEITSEIKDQKKIKEQIEAEQVAVQKVKDKKDKDVNDIKNLLDQTKTNIDAIKPENL